MTSKYTPTQELILDLLATRRHLGEFQWPIDKHPSTTKALKALQAMGLVNFKHGVAQGYWDASLTKAGQDLAMSPTYSPPLVERLKATEAARDSYKQQLFNCQNALGSYSGKV